MLQEVYDLLLMSKHTQHLDKKSAHSFRNKAAMHTEATFEHVLLRFISGVDWIWHVGGGMIVSRLGQVQNIRVHIVGGITDAITPTLKT